MRINSAYTVNKEGVLCYTGLPTLHTDLTFDHHNGEPYPNTPTGRLYEVGAVGKYGLIHGNPFRKFKM